MKSNNKGYNPRSLCFKTDLQKASGTKEGGFQHGVINGKILIATQSFDGKLATVNRSTNELKALGQSKQQSAAEVQIML